MQNFAIPFLLTVKISGLASFAHTRF